MHDDQDFKKLYNRYMKGMEEKIDEEQGDNSKNVEQQKVEHEQAMNFANRVFSNKDIKPMLFEYNKGK